MNKEETKNSKQEQKKENEQDLSQKQENLEETKKKLEKEIKQLKEMASLLAANSDNERKRHIEELKKMQQFANRELIREILPFLDNYNKALEAGKQLQDPKVDEFLRGFQMIANEFWKIMAAKGVEEIKITPKKDLFNSALHEIIDEIENNEVAPNTILEVARKGYLLNGQPLKYAWVKVSKQTKKHGENKN